MTDRENREEMKEKLLEALYDLSLSDSMLAAISAMTPREVALWRRGKEYPPNDSAMPLNPATGKPFSGAEMRRAIALTLQRVRREVGA